MKRSEIIILLTLAFVQFTHILDAMVMMPMGPLLKTSFGVDTEAFNFLVGSYGIAAFVSAVGATFWMDRFDRKKVLLILYMGFLAGTFACTMAPDYNFFLAARILTGLFGGVAGAVILSIVGDVIPLERRAQGMGILMGGFALASVAGVPIGIYLSEEFSWHAPFYLVCGIGVVVLLSIIFIMPPLTIHLRDRQNMPKQNLYKEVFSNKNQMLALLFSFCYVMAHFSIIPNITDYFVNNLGFKMKEQLVWMYVLGGVLSTFSSPLWGKLADKHGRTKVYIILSLLAIAPILLISNFTGSTLLQLLPVSAMFFIFSGGRMVPASAIVTSTVPPRLRGGFMSLNAAVQQLAIGIASIGTGMIITNDAAKRLHNYEIVGYIGIAFTIIAIIVGSKVRSVDGAKL
jgi:MFS transporter, DHA1 family, inner membrane transport protein